MACNGKIAFVYLHHAKIRIYYETADSSRMANNRTQPRT